MPTKIANNAVSRLSASLSAASTTLSIMPGDGAKFPTLAAGDWCPLTIVKTDGTLEVVKATARASDTFTVIRAQEGTAATDFAAGDRVELRLTAATLDAKLDQAKTEVAAQVATEVVTHAAASKAAPVDADEIPLVDSASTPDAWGLKKLTWGNLKAGVFAAWGALINGSSIKTEPVDADAIAIMDSATSNATKRLLLSNLKAFVLSFTSTNVASAATLSLTGQIGKTVHVTGTTAITAVTMATGQVIDLIFDGVLTLTHHATNNNLPGAANITTAAGDRARYFYDGATVYCMQYQKANGTPVAGGTPFASAAENAAGTVENKAVDPLGIREAFNATGSAPVYACRAWVNFNGTGTVAIRASGNVSSITDNGVGSYSVNFATPMPDDNYCITYSNGRDGADSTSIFPLISAGRGLTGFTMSIINAGFSSVDGGNVNVAIFR